MMRYLQRRWFTSALAALVGASGVLAAPALAFAANVTLTADTTVLLPSDGSSYTLTNGGTFDQLAVAGGTMTFTMSSGESVTITAAAPSVQLVNDSGFSYSCGVNTSMTISASSNITVNVTPATGCGSGSSGGGGGGVTTTSPGVTAATTTTATTTASVASTTPTNISAAATSGLSGAQVAAILSLLRSFNADASVIANVQASLGSGTGSSAGGGSGSFSRSLAVGATGADVMMLQRYLNTHGYVIAKMGPGSSGNETSRFGFATKAALAKLQKAAGITPASGFLGTKTRAYINAHP